jgi:DNA-directed RNA polymerase subunit beta'
MKEASWTTKLIETVAGRVIFNQLVPEEVGYVDELLSQKKSFRSLYADVFKITGMDMNSKFLDDIKDLGFPGSL